MVNFVAKLSKMGRDRVIVIPKRYVDTKLLKVGHYYIVSLKEIVEGVVGNKILEFIGKVTASPTTGGIIYVPRKIVKLNILKEKEPYFISMKEVEELR